jgi:hypothetical protein
MKKNLKLLALSAALITAATGVNASLVQNGSVDLTGQGYGAVPRLLTIQAHGNDTVESGAIGISGGALVALTPGILDANVFGGNGVRNLGGDTVNPLADNHKFGIPTLGELNWTTAANVGLLFNAAEPQSRNPKNSSALTIEDVTLKFYNGDSVIAAIDGNFSYASTEPGVGKAGFLISVDAAQQAFLDSAVFAQAGAAGFRIALESTISGVHGGAESFSALSVAAVPEPQTYAMMLAGLGLLGFARVRRTRQEK